MASSRYIGYPKMKNAHDRSGSWALKVVKCRRLGRRICVGQRRTRMRTLTSRWDGKLKMVGR